MKRFWNAFADGAAALFAWDLSVWRDDKVEPLPFLSADAAIGEDWAHVRGDVAIALSKTFARPEVQRALAQAELERGHVTT